MHCFKRHQFVATEHHSFTFVFTFSVVVVDLPIDCILSFLFPAETDVLLPVLSQSTDVVVANFVVVLKFPNVAGSTTMTIKKPGRTVDFSRSISFFRTASNILLVFISRAAWQHRYSSTITLSDFAVIVMICGVSERHIIQDIENNTHQKTMPNTVYSERVQVTCKESRFTSKLMYSS